MRVSLCINFISMDDWWLFQVNCKSSTARVEYFFEGSLATIEANTSTHIDREINTRIQRVRERPDRNLIERTTKVFLFLFFSLSLNFLSSTTLCLGMGGEGNDQWIFGYGSLVWKVKIINIYALSLSLSL